MGERQALVPRLRFPEFREAGEWQENQLTEIASLHKGKGISKADIKATGSQPCIRYGELYTVYGDVISDVFSKTDVPSDDLFMSREGDVIIPSSGETKIDIATAACVLQENIALGSDLNVIRSEQNGVFLSYYLNGSLKHEIAKVAQGDTVVHLYKSNLEALKIAIPRMKEQQKIADCLSSLDALITAQADKIDALKTHKKGLMQQLFPREGETVPCLRFPEFRDTGEWGMKKLSSVFIEDMRAFSMADEGCYELVTVKRRYGGVISRGVFRGKAIKVKTQFKLKEDDFLISKRQIVHCACGVVPASLSGSIVSNEYSVLRAREGFEISFLAYFSQQSNVSRSFLECSVGIVIEKMLFKLNDWLKREFLFPSLAEQKRIADCLSSLDELIITHTVKLNTLKTHKKGLMQQLFPSPESVSV